jgi:hypothetical protein
MRASTLGFKRSQRKRNFSGKKCNFSNFQECNYRTALMIHTKSFGSISVAQIVTRRRSLGDTRTVLMKRRAEEESKGGEPKKNAKKSPQSQSTLVVLPGAGGAIAKDMRAFLDSEQTTASYTVLFPKTGWQWNTRNAGAQENFDLVNSLLKGVASESKLILMGHSFGNRVIAHMLQQDINFGKHKMPDYVVFCAYPLFAEKDDTKNNSARKAPLLEIPLKYKKILVISGDKDEFLNRAYQKTKGAEVLVCLLHSDFTSEFSFSHCLEMCCSRDEK